MLENRRVIGAKEHIYNNIKFKSGLEVSCYKKLELSGLDFSYESERVILWEGIKLHKTQVYAPKKIGNGRYSRELTLQTRALLNTTYTPDFIVVKNNYYIYFDVKGQPNDLYPLKKKLFLKVLEERITNHQYIFFEPHSVKQMQQAIDIIKTL